MSSWELLDSRGFENLKLGDDRASIRERLGPYRTVRRWGTTETDQFVELGLVVQYTADDLASFIELSGPVLPTIKGVALIGRPLNEVIDELNSRGLTTTIVDEAIVDIDGWNAGLYSEGDIVKAVSVGS